MVVPSTGQVVLVPFPFSDLSQSKLRPAVVLADASRGDWILCQVTSNAYSDLLAIEITPSDFRTASLQVTSYARQGKIFTANQSPIVSGTGNLTPIRLKAVVDAITNLLESGIPP